MPTAMPSATPSPLTPTPPSPPLALAWRTESGPQHVPLSADRTLVLGRDPACDIVFDSLAVSRRHAQVAFDGASHVLRALSRSSPTRLNGRVVVRDTPLAAGDTVHLAMVQLDVVAADAVAASDDSDAEVASSSAANS